MATQKRLEEIREIRMDRVAKMRSQNINPYPSKLNKPPISISKARESEGNNVVIAGRLMAWRTHGNIIFGDLKDETGQIQLFFQKKSLGGAFKLLKNFDIGDFLLTEGRVFKTEAQELTLDVSEFQLLTKSVRPMPTAWHGMKDVEDRYRQRYVDLNLNDEIREVFNKKAMVMRELREYLHKKGFTEATTPALQPLYGGATAKPFTTHHNALDNEFYLRISDELYLKRLIVGGFHKVYEMAKVFRNEGIDRWHNPEFTMLEFYWAYADYEQLMELTENMITEVVKKVTGSTEISYGDQKVNFATPWKRISYADALKEIGVTDFASKDPDEIDAIYKEKVRPNLIAPVFLTDHPFSMRPLAKRKEGTDFVESFQLVAAGAELINAYSELNDPQDQRARWEKDMKRGKEGADEYQVIDEDYIRALEYGMPPTAGWGMGIDRLTALLTNQHSIKDTILFPTLRPENKKEND